jgi:hypothetical protein
MVPIIFIGTVIVIVCLLLFHDQLFSSSPATIRQTKVIVPRNNEGINQNDLDTTAEQLAYNDIAFSKIALAEDEQLYAILTQDLDGDSSDEQVIAFQKKSETDGVIYLTYIDFDETLGLYKRIWSIPTIVTKGKTIQLYTKDMIGDHSNCLLLFGLNDSGEQTLTVFKKANPLKKIGEFKVDGSISIKEAERSQAYQLGLSKGDSFTISTYSRDYESTNILDQIEVIYGYDSGTDQYERIGTARIRGSQIEQRQIRELLNGTPAKFEQFLAGVWYYANAKDGLKQYIYFDPDKREIIFYTDDTQEVYSWQNSNTTRYGIYIISQNISVTTLRRLIDISLESHDSIVVRIFEDVNLKIGVSDHWDGSYRKFSVTEQKNENSSGFTTPLIDAMYESSLGTFVFSSNGNFEQNNGTLIYHGKYTFLTVDGIELLELQYNDRGNISREVYQLKRGEKDTTLYLTRVRIGTKGIVSLNEEPLSLHKISQEPQS